MNEANEVITQIIITAAGILFLLTLLCKRWLNKLPQKIKSLSSCFRCSFDLPSVAMALGAAFILAELSSIRATAPNVSLLGFIISTTISPLGEEVLFRGVGVGVLSEGLITLCKQKPNGMGAKITSWLLVVIGAGVFMIAHPGDIWRKAFTFVAGLLFGGVYILAKKNIMAPFLAHVVNNLLVHLATWGIDVL